MSKKKRQPQPITRHSPPPSPNRASAAQGDGGRPSTLHPQPSTFSYWPHLVFAALAFLLYANTLGHGYVLDDDLALRLHPNVSRGFAGIGDIFLAPYRDGCFGGCLYRPLTLVSFAIEWALAPNQPHFNHLMNVLWYAATAALLFATLRRLLAGYPAVLAYAATLLFVVHPVHTEVVANIKSRDEILCFFFLTAAIYCFLRTLQTPSTRWMLGAAAAYGCALLSKESAVTALPVFPLLAWTIGRQSAGLPAVAAGEGVGSSLAKSAWALAPLLLFFLLRGAALSGLSAPPTSYLDNPIMGATGYGERWATAWVVMGKYLGLLFAPLTLLCDYSYNAVPLARPGDVGAIVALLIHLGLLGYALWQLPKRNPLALCILAYLAAMALYSQLIVVVGTLMGERLLYWPSLWWALGVPLTLFFLLKIPLSENAAAGFSWKNLSSKEKTLAYIAIGLAALFSLKTVGRNADWSDNLRLFQSDVVKAPNSVRLNDGCADELVRSMSDPNLSDAERERRGALADQHARQSLRIEPKSISANLSVGNIALFRKQYPEAVAAYEKCLEIKPDYDKARSNLALALLKWAHEEGEKNGNIAKARELLQRSLTYNDQQAEAWRLLGVSYGVQGQHAEAAKMFEKALALDPQNKDIQRDYETARKASGQ